MHLKTVTDSEYSGGGRRMLRPGQTFESFKDSQEGLTDAFEDERDNTGQLNEL